MSIYLKEDLIDEVTLMNKGGICTVLSFSEYASPIFAHRRPKWKTKSTCGCQDYQKSDCG